MTSPLLVPRTSVAGANSRVLLVGLALFLGASRAGAAHRRVQPAPQPPAPTRIAPASDTRSTDAPPTTRALVLLRMAVGETAPRGPAADRARAEAVKLLRTPDLQADAAAHPDSAARLRHLAAQLAA